MPHRLEPIDRESMPQQVVRAIRHAITSGAMRPGERLVEQTLSDELGVSRAPLREALRQLTSEGLLVALPHKGTMVVELTRDDVLEIYRLRAALEPLAVERIIERGDPADVVALRVVIGELRAALPVRDPAVIASLDMRFHELLCQLSGLPRLLAAWRSLGNQLRSYFTVANFFFDDFHIIENHEEIVRAIERSDVDEVHAVLQRHILGAGESVIRRWDEGGTG